MIIGDEMSNDEQRRTAPPMEAHFISGWFTQQFEAGKQPEYGYPTNHLPETHSDTMEMVTGFIASKGE
jgi:hypothetical protein